MKKILITFGLLLMAVGIFGQNTFRYIINANGGIVVTAPFSFGGIIITATGAQINFLNTTTSNVQTQLNSKLAITDTTAAFGKYARKASPVFTGTPTVPGYVPTSRTVNGHALTGDVSVTITDLSLNNVDNTSDVNKPVSTATQNALNLKLNVSNPTATGTLTTPILKVGNSASNTITSLDSISKATGATDISFYDGPDTLNPYIPFSGRVDLYEAMDTSLVIATKHDLTDTVVFETEELLDVAVAKADSVGGGTGTYVTGRDFIIGQALKISVADSANGSGTTGTYVTGKDHKTDIALANKVGFIISMGTAGIATPTDNTTYYFGNFQTAQGTTNAATRQTTLPFDCTLIGFALAIKCTASPTTETSTLYLRVNNTTDLTLSTALNFVGATTPAYYSSAALNTDYSAGDKIECKLLTATWVTDPTAIMISIDLYFKNR